jgi:hypothetical protein
MHAAKREEAGVKRPLGGRARRLSFVLSVALSLGVISTTVTTPARGEATEEEENAAIPGSVANPIRLAEEALAEAKAQVAKRQLDEAITSLGAVRDNVEKAHTAGMAQMGKPPSDPESDDPPGPPSVIAVLGLEHRVATGVVPLFNGSKEEKAFVDALLNTLSVTYTTRDEMLNRVIGLDPEGAGADYADDVGDTGEVYTAEVKQITTALNQYQLSPSGQQALSDALTRVRATQAKVDKAFGDE